MPRAVAMRAFASPSAATSALRASAIETAPAASDLMSEVSVGIAVITLIERICTPYSAHASLACAIAELILAASKKLPAAVGMGWEAVTPPTAPALAEARPTPPLYCTLPMNEASDAL